MSLQGFCLNVVVQNMEQFLDMFQAGKFPKYFEFLQRGYSEVLFTNLTKKGLLKNAHLPFLMNRYLRSLTLNSKCCLDVDIVIERLKMIGKSITHVDLRNRDFPEQILLHIIPYIPNVENLYLPSERSTDKVLRRICQCCPNVCELHLSSSSVSGTELRGLVRRDDKGDLINTKLTKLFIQGARVMESDLTFLLTNCPNLQILDHDLLVQSLYTIHKNIHNPSPNVIPKYKLELLSSFSLDFFGKSDVVKLAVAMCPLVEMLIVKNISQHSVSALSKLGKLRHAELHSAMGVDYVPFLAATGCSLTNLQLSNGSVSLEALKCCSELKYLTLHEVRFTSSSCISPSSADAAFPNLKHLSFEFLDFHEKDALEAVSFILLNSRNLKSLFFIRCRLFTRNLLPFLLQCESVRNARELCFNGVELDLSTAKRILTSSTKHKTVKIKCCDLSEIKCKILTDFVRHENLNLELVIKSSEHDIFMTF